MAPPSASWGWGYHYALKGVIGDVVAGVYLLRDPDFSVGDRIVTGEGFGEVVDVDLRKTRIRTEDGDLLVVSNSSVDKKWTRKE
ncbi:MAG: Large-conductance mechanosensitive channel MscMJLR [Methanonatronarchaeales archaeon]|nr:Large-conductance mechanosensitive channel MscMJLR [Methanonatronarchaeales archaeon]MBS1264018.1 Large-conductance mechanosensitive channel MscMJLR [Methanonatronarchaeales archaeon]